MNCDDRKYFESIKVANEKFHCFWRIIMPVLDIQTLKLELKKCKDENDKFKKNEEQGNEKFEKYKNDVHFAIYVQDMLFLDLLCADTNQTEANLKKIMEGRSNAYVQFGVLNEDERASYIHFIFYAMENKFKNRK